MSRRLNWSCAIADHRPVLAGRGNGWTGLDRTGPNAVQRHWRSGSWDRRIGIGWLWGRGLTDLLDNGLTESLTHGARDFLGGCGQAVEGEDEGGGV